MDHFPREEERILPIVAEIRWTDKPVIYNGLCWYLTLRSYIDANNGANRLIARSRNGVFGVPAPVQLPEKV